MKDNSIRAADKYDNMNEFDLRESIRFMETRLETLMKESIEKLESIQKKFEDTQNELIASKEENRHLNKQLQESKSQIQQLEFEKNNLTQQLLDIRSFEIETANTRIINDRMRFENDRLDRYVWALINSHSKQSIQPFMEGNM